MRNSLAVLVISSLVLTSCGSVRDSRLNPFNWFGRAERVEIEAPASAEEVNPLLPRQERRGWFSPAEELPYQGTPVAQITNLTIERVADGAIIRATGVTSIQGAFEVRLVPANEDHLPVDGVLTYQLMAVQPSGFRQGTTRSRQLTAAVFRTDQELTGVRSIRVEGAESALVSRRR